MKAPTKKRKSKKQLQEDIERTKKLLAMKEGELLEQLRSGTLSENEVALVESRIDVLRERDREKLRKMTDKITNGRNREA